MKAKRRNSYEKVGESIIEEEFIKKHSMKLGWLIMAFSAFVFFMAIAELMGYTK